MKALIDRDRRPGRFLLTGSADVLSMPRMAESLVGRMEVATLWPLSQGELSGQRARFVDTMVAGERPDPSDSSQAVGDHRGRGPLRYRITSKRAIQRRTLTMPLLPATLDTEIRARVAYLATCLTCAPLEASSHRTIVVTGWDTAPALEAIAVYLVGLLASAISTALRVRAQITDSQDDRLELVANVHRLVGSSSSSFSDTEKSGERNPWLAEGMWHLCLFLSQIRTDFHPAGAVVALQLPHIYSNDHGFDVFALYRTGDTLGASFVESKAYARNPNGAIGDAVTYFAAIDAGDHHGRLRQTVAAMRDGLPTDAQPLFSPSLWKDLRTYIPNPHYDNATVVDWQTTRRSFAKLAVPREQILIMPHAVQGFASFFDTLSDKMRDFATAVANV